MADNPNPYSARSVASSPGASSRPNKWLWIMLGGAMIVVPLVCCGGIFLVAYFGLGVLESDIEMQLRDHPTISEHLGQIEDLSVNITKSSAIDDPDTFIYDIRGSQGTAELIITSISHWDGNEEIVEASLRLESGEVIEIELPAEADQ